MDQVLTKESPVARPPAALGADEPPIDQVRPRIRRDVIFAQTSDGAFLRHAESGFVLKGRTAYQWIAALLPHFTGEVTVADLCHGLSGEQRDLIRSMVTTLLERGFVRDYAVRRGAELPTAVAGRYQSQLDFVDHYASDVTTRFACFRGSRVLVAGGVPAAVAAAESLLRNGLEHVDVQLDPRTAADDRDRLTAEAHTAVIAGAPASVRQVTESIADLSVRQLAGYDVIVAFADHGKAADVVGLIRRLPNGPVLLPVTVVGHRAIFGPITRAGTAPCLTCLLLRLGANLPAAEVADLWRGAVLPGLPAPAALSENVSARMIGNAVAFDVFRWRTGTLPAETDQAVVIQDLETLDTVRERLLPHPLCPSCRDHQEDGMPETPGAMTGEQQLQRLLRPVAAHAGIFSGFDDGQVDQSPLKVGRIRLGPAGFPGRAARIITAFDVDTAADARRRVLYQAAQVYLEQVADPERALPEPPAGARAVAAGSLLTYAGVPSAAPFRRWLRATSFISGEPCYVPADAVHPGQADAIRRFEVTSAGCGAGPDQDSAVTAGIGSALAYHALRQVLAGHPARPLEPPAAVAEDSPAGFLVRAGRHFGIEPRLYLLPGAPGFPVVMAVGEAGPRDDTAWTMGWGPGGLVAALRDLVGQRQLLEAGTEADLGNPLLAGFHPGCLRVDDGTGPVRYAEVGNTATAVVFGDVLAAAGLDALVVDVTSADLRATGVVSAVRVLLAKASQAG